MGKHNPTCQFSLRIGWLESSFAQDDLKILVDKKLAMSQ